MPRTHVPVLAGELIEALDPHPGEIAVDCTLGAAGHARLVADRLGAAGTLIAIDRDPLAEKAFAELAQFHGTKFDPTPVINARTSLEELAIDYPDLARQENVEAVVERIDAALARKVYQNAHFYLRTHEQSAAAYTFKYLIKNYPESPEAGRAKIELAQLPKNVQQGGIAPTSKPQELQLNVK